MSNQRSGDLKLSRKERFAKLPTEMKERIAEFEIGLQGIRESTRDNYLARIAWYGNYLLEHDILQFEKVGKKDIDLFLSRYKNSNTRNLFVQVFRAFYKELKPEVVCHLKIVEVEIEEITPSEILSVDEVVALAKECGKKRELMKYLVLTLFESCARISEVLNLRLGDVIFGSVASKDGKRALIATLYFKRSKGGVKKQPITMVMFASELKKWVDNHPYKGNEQAWLFPSPIHPAEPVSHENTADALWYAGERLGIRKKVNPHFFRHSGLSYFANTKGYSDILLGIRAGWTPSSQMSKRYIHTGSEIERRVYLEKMGLIEADKEPEKQILPKTCPHCQGLNPYTNTHCDLCASSLDAAEYEKEVEKRQNIEQLYLNINNLADKKLTLEQEKELGKRTDTVLGLLELGRDDLAKEYISKLLEHWTKVFLTA